MAKFKVNYERKSVTCSGHLIDLEYIYNGLCLQWFIDSADEFCQLHGVQIKDVNFTFELGDCSGEMGITAERMETDAEMAERIAIEEARVALDEENARKSQEKKAEREQRSKAKQIDRDREALENLRKTYGDEWIKSNIPKDFV